MCECDSPAFANPEGIREASAAVPKTLRPWVKNSRRVCQALENGFMAGVSLGEYVLRRTEAMIQLFGATTRSQGLGRAAGGLNAWGGQGFGDWVGGCTRYLITTC